MIKTEIAIEQRADKADETDNVIINNLTNTNMNDCKQKAHVK